MSKVLVCLLLKMLKYIHGNIISKIEIIKNFFLFTSILWITKGYFDLVTYSFYLKFTSFIDFVRANSKYLNKKKYGKNGLIYKTYSLKKLMLIYNQYYLSTIYEKKEKLIMPNQIKLKTFLSVISNI